MKQELSSLFRLVAIMRGYEQGEDISHLLPVPNIHQLAFQLGYLEPTNERMESSGEWYLATTAKGREFYQQESQIQNWTRAVKDTLRHHFSTYPGDRVVSIVARSREVEINVERPSHPGRVIYHKPGGTWTPV